MPVKLKIFVHHTLPLASLNITAQSLPPLFVRKEIIDRYTEKTLGNNTFYNPPIFGTILHIFY